VKKRPFEKDIYTWVDKMKGESDDKLEEEAWESEQEKSDPPFYSVYSDEEIESMRKDVEEQMDYYHAHKYDEGKTDWGLIPEVCFRELNKVDTKYFWAKAYVDICKASELSFVRILAGVRKVLEGGALDYGRESWKTIPDAQQRFFAAFNRHMCDDDGIALKEGHRDSKSGLPSIHHALANVLFLLWFEIQESK